MYCEKCGSELKVDTLFCQFCGTKSGTTNDKSLSKETKQLKEKTAIKPATIGHGYRKNKKSRNLFIVVSSAVILAGIIIVISQKNENDPAVVSNGSHITEEYDPRKSNVVEEDMKNYNSETKQVPKKNYTSYAPNKDYIYTYDRSPYSEKVSVYKCLGEYQYKLNGNKFDPEEGVVGYVWAFEVDGVVNKDQREVFFETEKGLFTFDFTDSDKFVDSDYDLMLSYPIVRGSQFTQDKVTKNRIMDVDLTFETPASKFEKVIKLLTRNPDRVGSGGHIYYAPDVGIIETSNYKLIKLEKVNNHGEKQLDSQTSQVEELMGTDHVYWTDYGASYHLYSDCYHINGEKTSKIYDGTVSKARQLKNITGICDTCVVKAEKNSSSDEKNPN